MKNTALSNVMSQLRSEGAVMASDLKKTERPEPTPAVGHVQSKEFWITQYRARWGPRAWS